MKRIKVLHCIHSLVSGGAEKQLRLLSQGMNKDAFDVGIFCVKAEGHDITDTRVHIFSNYYSNLLNANFIRSIHSCLKTFDPDIVHVWLPQSVSIPAMLLSRLMGKRVIFSYRNQMTFQRPLVFPEFFVALLFSERIISNCAPNESNMAFQWLYRIKKGEIIENAVSVPENFRKLARVRGAPVRLLVVGRLTKQKNVKRLIQALTGIPKTANWIVDIYGEGELKAELTELIKMQHLQDRVFLRGFCHSIYNEMCNSDALLFPSLYEGMPNALVEALQIGLPIIASDIAANRAIIGDKPAALWLDPNNTKDMSRIISRFIAGEEDTQSIVECGRAVAARFSLQAMISRYENYYKELAQ